MIRPPGLDGFGLRCAAVAVAAWATAATSAALDMGPVNCRQAFTLTEYRAAHIFEYLESQRAIVQRAAVRAEQISQAYYACGLHTLVIGYGYRGRCHCGAGIELHNPDGLRHVSLARSGFNLFHPLGKYIYVETAVLREPRPPLDKRLVPGESGVRAFADDAARIPDYTDLCVIDVQRAAVERTEPLPAILAIWPARNDELYLRMFHPFRSGYIVRFTPRSGRLHPMPETGEDFEPRRSWSPFFPPVSLSATMKSTSRVISPPESAQLLASRSGRRARSLCATRKRTASGPPRITRSNRNSPPPMRVVCSCSAQAKSWSTSPPAAYSVAALRWRHQTASREPGRQLRPVMSCCGESPGKTRSPRTARPSWSCTATTSAVCSLAASCRRPICPR
jgi:hypothetical protein